MQRRFTVKASKIFSKELGELPQDIALEITRALKILEVSPPPSGTLIKKLKGFVLPLYHLRVSDYRALYRIIGNEVAILRIVDHTELERELKRMIR